MSPVIRNIVGQPRTTFKRARIILANLDRATLGDMTARLLGGLLIARSTGQVVITDYGFFSAPVPFAQDRFTIALNFLDEVPAKLKQEVLGIDEKYVFKTNKKDADELSFYVGVMNPSMIMDLSNNAFRVTGSDRIHQTVQSHNLRRLTPLKKRTRACHTVPRLKVEREIRGYLE